MTKLKKPPRLTRARADQMIHRLLERTESILQDSNTLYLPTTMVLFGSYLSDKDPIGDVDVAIRLRPRYNDSDTQMNAVRALVDAEVLNGRRFPNLTVKLTWPVIEVLKRLRGRDYPLSFVDLDSEKDTVQGGPHRILFGNM